MSLHEVTMWTVECDQPGCLMSTTSVDGYCAWGDRSAAVEEWTDCGGVVVDDGTAWCEDHVPAEVCRESDDHEHRWLDDPSWWRDPDAAPDVRVTVACDECGAERDDGRMCPGYIRPVGGHDDSCRWCHGTGWTVRTGEEP